MDANGAKGRLHRGTVGRGGGVFKRAVAVAVLHGVPEEGVSDDEFVAAIQRYHSRLAGSGLDDLEVLMHVVSGVVFQ